MANGGAPPLSQPASRPCEGLAPGDHSRTQLTMARLQWLNAPLYSRGPSATREPCCPATCQHTRSYAAASLKPFTAQLRGDVLVHDGRALETYELGPSSVPRSPTSSEAAILTYSTFDCSDGAHTMPLRSSLISRRFSSSTFRTHIRRPSACTRPNRSRAIRFGRHETLPRISHSPRASARMKLAPFLCPLSLSWVWKCRWPSHLCVCRAGTPPARYTHSFLSLNRTFRGWSRRRERRARRVG